MIKQYILLRNDAELSFGALLAQVSHLSVKCVFKFYDDPITQLYMRETSMTTIILQINEVQMKEAVEYFNNNHIKYCDWKEMPEDIYVGLALKPIQVYEHKELLKFLKQFKLFTVNE